MSDRAAERTRVAVDSEVRRVSDLLRRRVAGAGLSQKQVERRLGWGEGYLSQLLTGKVDLKFRHLFGLAEALGFSPRDFFAELYPAVPAARVTPAGSGDRPELRRLVAEVLRELAAGEDPRRRVG